MTYPGGHVCGPCRRGQCHRCNDRRCECCYGGDQG